MRISNGNFLDEDGNEVNLVELLRTGKATPVVNNNDGHHMSAHSGWFTDENGTPVNIVALIDAAIDEDGGDDEPAIGGISINGGNVVTPDANGIINLTISGDGSTVIDSELSASSTNPVQNRVVTGEIEELSEAVDSINGSLGMLESASEDANYYFQCTFYDGYINANGEITPPGATAEKYTSLIELPADGKIGLILRYPEDQAMWLIYALYDNNQEFIRRVNLRNNVTTKSANEIITVYNNSANSRAKFIRFSFRTFNDFYFSVYNPISDRLNDNILNTNSIKNSIGEYTNTFSVQSGVEHSSNADLISVDIKSGESFIVLVKSTVVTGAQIYVRYNDNTSERIYSGKVLNQIFEAKKDIVKLSLYIASAFIVSDGICKVDVIKYGIALSLNSVNANYSSSIKSVNHRGFITAPENTLPAYKLSRKMGFAYVETDINFTLDDIPVLLHDTKINRVARNSDGSEISELVNITDITYEQALAYDFGIYKGEQYAGTKIPTFTEFMMLCKRLGLHPYVELKRGTQEQINSLVTIAKRYDMLENITWISFYTSLLGYIKTNLPNARLGYLVDTVTSTEINNAVALKTSENKVFIDTDYTNLTPEIVESCVDADLPLEVYTVDNVNAFATIDSYVSGYTSNMFIGSKVLLELYS